MSKVAGVVTIVIFITILFPGRVFQTEVASLHSYGEPTLGYQDLEHRMRQGYLVRWRYGRSH